MAQYCVDDIVIDVSQGSLGSYTPMDHTPIIY